MYRQGDVLLEATDVIPAAAQLVPRDAGRVVLAYGERIGHAHAISDPDVQLLALGGERFLRVEKPTTLLHEEHDPIALDAGTQPCSLVR